MAFHTLAYLQTTFTGTLASVNALNDGIFQVSNNRFVLPGDMQLIAAYAQGANLTAARVNAPSLRGLAPAYIRPIAGAALPPNDKQIMMSLVANPLLMRGQEEISLEATVSSSDTVTALLFLQDKMEPVPPGRNMWLKFTSTTAPAQNVWTALTTTYADTIPAGLYAVIGFEFYQTNAIAARLIFDNQTYRPGTIAVNGASGLVARTHAHFYEAALGVYGTFRAYSPPRIEVLCNRTAAINNEGYIRVVQLSQG